MRAVATHGEHNIYIGLIDSMKDENATMLKAGTAFLSYIPFDHNRSPLFELVCGYQIFNAWLYGIYIGSIDTILTGFMIHAKAQFLIVKNLLAHIIEKAEELYVSFVIFEWHVLNNSCLQLDEEPKQDPVIVEMIKSINKPYKRNHETELLPPALQKYALRIINECARHHLDIINLCMSLEDEITSLMLVQMVASVIMLCFNLFQLSLVYMRKESQ